MEQNFQYNSCNSISWLAVGETVVIVIDMVKCNIYQKSTQSNCLFVCFCSVIFHILVFKSVYLEVLSLDILDLCLRGGLQNVMWHIMIAKFSLFLTYVFNLWITLTEHRVLIYQLSNEIFWDVVLSDVSFSILN